MKGIVGKLCEEGIGAYGYANVGLMSEERVVGFVPQCICLSITLRSPLLFCFAVFCQHRGPPFSLFSLPGYLFSYTISHCSYLEHTQAFESIRGLVIMF